MGIFSSLFGRKPDTKEALIRAIAALRIRTDPASKMLGYNERMLDDLSLEQIYMLPEASIVTMVETFVGFRRKGVPARQAIEAIEQFRSQTFRKLPLPLPNSFFDFVAARIHLEHRSGAQLDEEFIDNAVHTSAKVFGLEMEMPDRPPYITHLKFDIERYEVVLASYKRRERGYLFPWRLMAFEKESRTFAFSFNLEVTPFSCCLGSHQANGVHLNLGEADPEMPQAEFEEWVLPKLLRAVYGNNLMSEEEIHTLAVRFVSNHIKKDGYEIEFADEALGSDPQIYAVSPDGTTIAIIVRGAVFPLKPKQENYYDEVKEAIDCESAQEVLFASVMLGNSQAKNDIERRVVLKNAPASVWFDGLEACFEP